MKHFRKTSLRRMRKTTSSSEKEKQEAKSTAPPLTTLSDAVEPLNELKSDSLALPPAKEEMSSRRSSAASSKKALQVLPASQSSAALTSKASLNLRQLALSSSNPSSNPNSPNLSFSKKASNASLASENWTAPEDAEGEYIRKTYAHFDVSGIKGDGLVEGKEFTRERGARAAWEASESLASIEPFSQSHLTPPVNAHDAAKARTAVKHSSPLAGKITLLNNKSTEEVISSSGSKTERLEQPTLSVNDSFGQSSSSLGSHSAESTNAPPKVTTESDKEMEAERKELLKNVDRYGFFNKEGQSSRSRITIVPADALRSIPKRRTRQVQKLRKGGRGSRSSDIAGSDPSSADDPYTSASEKSSSHQAALQSIMQSRDSKELSLREREAIRVAKWDRMLEVRRSDLETSCYVLATGMIRTKKFRKRVYKGIPDRWRSAAWWAILLSQSEKATNLSQAEQNYRLLLDVPSPHDVQIDLDVPRTISGHILFHTRYGQGQRSLFHVLHAFSMLCPQCAYCQGMGPIVATLLVYFTPEKAYAVMTELHNRSLYGLHSTFQPGFPGLVENFYVQKKLCEKLCPEVVESLESNGIVISSYATKWYITLYTNVLPFSTQLRLWDCFLLQGKNLLVIIAIAILWSLRDQLINGGFETAMNLLTREFLPVDDDALVNWIYIIMEREDTQRRMRDARREYRSLVQQGKEPVL